MPNLSYYLALHDLAHSSPSMTDFIVGAIHTYACMMEDLPFYPSSDPILGRGSAPGSLANMRGSKNQRESRLGKMITPSAIARVSHNTYVFRMEREVGFHDVDVIASASYRNMDDRYVTGITSLFEGLRLNGQKHTLICRAGDGEYNNVVPISNIAGDVAMSILDPAVSMRTCDNDNTLIMTDPDGELVVKFAGGIISYDISPCAILDLIPGRILQMHLRKIAGTQISFMRPMMDCIHFFPRDYPDAGGVPVIIPRNVMWKFSSAQWGCEMMVNLPISCISVAVADVIHLMIDSLVETSYRDHCEGIISMRSRAIDKSITDQLASMCDDEFSQYCHLMKLLGFRMAGGSICAGNNPALSWIGQ